MKNLKLLSKVKSWTEDRKFLFL